MRDRLVALGRPADKLIVVPNAPDLARFDPAIVPIRPFRADGRLRIVYTGALTPVYELDVALRALARIAAERPDLDACLELFGRGDSEADLRAMAAELGIAERVTFHGRIPLEDVPAAVAAADLGIAPTRLDDFTATSLSTKVFEYAALRKPVVASRLPLVERTFGTGAVVTYPSGDDAAMAAAIVDLADDERDRQDRVERAAVRVAELGWATEADSTRPSWTGSTVAAGSRRRRPMPRRLIATRGQSRRPGWIPRRVARTWKPRSSGSGRWRGAPRPSRVPSNASCARRRPACGRRAPSSHHCGDALDPPDAGRRRSAPADRRPSADGRPEPRSRPAVAERRRSSMLTASAPAEARLAAALADRGTLALGVAPRVSIVMLNRNGAGHLRRCLPRLATVAYGDVELVIVDNASTDASLDVIRELAPPYPLKVIENAENMPFSDANNTGAVASSGSLLLFLNNDIEPIGDRWLARLVETLLDGDGSAEPAAVAVGARLVYPRRTGQPRAGLQFPDLSLQHGGIDFRMLDGAPIARPMGAGDDPLSDWAAAVRDVPAVTAACLLVRRTDFEAVGGFSAGYDFGHEDVDLCLKLRSLDGRIVYDGRAALWHHESATRELDDRQARRARVTANRDRFTGVWASSLYRTVLADAAHGGGFWSTTRSASASWSRAWAATKGRRWPTGWPARSRSGAGCRSL